MTTDSQFYDRSQRHIPSDLPDGRGKLTNESTGDMDMVKRDRFELLSAYLDGEVTAAERRQVEEWLATDTSVQCLYSRLVKLRQGLRTLPVPETQPAEATAKQVFSRLNRRSRIAWTVGGAAIAACVISAVSGLISGSERTPQLAQQPQVEPTQAVTQPEAPASPLMVALNNPVIEIPKAAVVLPEKPVKNPALPRLESNIEKDIN